MMNKIKIGILWTRALGYTSRSEYAKALEVVERINELLEGVKKSVPLRSEIKTLEGFLHYALGSYIEGAEVLSEAFQEVERSIRRTPAEKSYLKCYASVWGLKCVKEGGIQKETNFVVDYDSVPLDDVGVSLKINFPLRGHPDWDESAIRKSWRVKK